MIEAQSVTKDPVCGMTVDEKTAGVTAKDKPGGCC